MSNNAAMHRKTEEIGRYGFAIVTLVWFEGMRGYEVFVKNTEGSILFYKSFGKRADAEAFAYGLVYGISIGRKGK